MPHAINVQVSCGLKFDVFLLRTLGLRYLLMFNSCEVQFALDAISVR